VRLRKLYVTKSTELSSQVNTSSSEASGTRWLSPATPTLRHAPQRKLGAYFKLERKHHIAKSYTLQGSSQHLWISLNAFFWGVKLTARLHPVPRLMRGAIPPLPHTCSWRGA